jgi:hypothetical protein
LRFDNAAAGGALGGVDLIYRVPEPSAAVLAAFGLVALLKGCVRRSNAA